MDKAHEQFDIVIIGGGHAGTEAAWAASHMLGERGSVAMVTMDPLAIGRMSCNPAIGGLAKGQMVREIDALGGLMGRAIDATGIQFRMLNRSKGPAVQSPRAQADKYRYATKVQELLRENCANLAFVTGIVDRFLTEEGRLRGVVLGDGRTLHCRCAVVTTGTFLRALMHTGEQKTEGGRVGEQTARGLSGSLRELGFELGRLKTGTPPRLAKETIDFAGLEAQPGDDPPVPFSELTDPGRFPTLEQVPMHITHTNAHVHEVIRQNIHRAPMYSGQIISRGPRYCPSIEDKVVRFADKEKHQIFLEPEGLETNEIYCNGISTSLPADVQQEVVRSIKGLEHAKILRLGYAVEYDFVPTQQVDATLETRLIDGLFLAGQINGTSGYEEAAGQGQIAGINAARKVQGAGRFILTRDQAYIGVMIDDLITKVPTEPYRMFTSRAEFRLSLRSDNADQRLTIIGAELGLAGKARVEKLARKMAAMRRAGEILQTTRLAIGASGTTAYELLRRPDVDVAALRKAIAENGTTSGGSTPGNLFEDDELSAVLVQVEIEAKYAGYIERENQAAGRMRELEGKMIPTAFDFAGIGELRKEARQSLEKFRPQTIGQASRLEGMTPSDLTVLMIHLQGKRRG